MKNFACHATAYRARVGSATASDLTDDKWDHGSSDGEVFNTIKNGVAPAYAMQPWEGQISDKNIWNVVIYIRSLAAPVKVKDEPNKQ
jgi:mono/diheme cytochrome c family protein